ncbi:MAG: serine hydroxymethyltransferase [Pseudomonadota bacterium]
MVGGELDEVYFEFHAVGNQMRVAAIDGRSGMEVVVFGPVGTPESHLKTLGLAKLKRRLGISEPKTKPDGDDGPGILV